MTTDPTPEDYERFVEEAEIGYHDGHAILPTLMARPDPAVWAAAFRDQFGDQMPDELILTTWFRKAMEAGGH